MTALEAAARAHVPLELVRRRPDLLRLGGHSLPEVYFAFQFDESGVRPPVGTVVQRLKQTYQDRDISEWMATPHPDLEYVTPVGYLHHGGAIGTVMKAAAHDGPIATPPPLR